MKLRYLSGVCCILFLAFPCQCLAFPATVVTLLDGKSSLLRGPSRHSLKEGLRLQSGDVIETPAASHVQIETGDGAALALGGESKVLFLPTAGKRNATEIFLLTGAVKVAVVKGAAPVRITSQHLAVMVANSTAVIMVASEESAAFAEIGLVNVEQGGEVVKIRDREYFSVRSGQKPALASSPPKSFIDKLPRMFLDDLPRRMSEAKDRKVKLGNSQKFTYAEVEPWLNSVPPVRKALISLWKTSSQDPKFRNALIKNLKAHPEWERVLFPEKFILQPTIPGSNKSTTQSESVYR